jgi:hypothetical protein
MRLLFFTASWCGPCKKIRPALAQACGRRQLALLDDLGPTERDGPVTCCETVRVDRADDDPLVATLMTQCAVSAIPLLVLVDGTSRVVASVQPASADAIDDFFRANQIERPTGAHRPAFQLPACPEATICLTTERATP